MKGLLFAESLNLDLVKIQVRGCWYKQTHVLGAISRLFVSLRLFFGGGGPKSILFSLFRNKKASFKGVNTLNGFPIRVSFNTESLNGRAIPFKGEVHSISSQS